MYTQAISAMRTFAGDEASLSSSWPSAEAEGELFSAQTMPAIKKEVNAVEDADVYKAYGGNAPPWKRGYGRSRGWSRNNRGYRGRQDGGKQDGGAQRRGVEKLNPKNRFGDYLRYHGCGLLRHI